MESTYKNDNDRDKLTTCLTGLNKTEWEEFSQAFIGQCASSTYPCDAPLHCSVGEYLINRVTLGMGDDEEATRNECMAMNSKAMGKLAHACRLNPMARGICEKYMPGSNIVVQDSSGNDVEVVRLDGDANNCWAELKSTALGGVGVATAENTVSQLMQLDPSTMDAIECISRTESLYRRLRGLKAFTIDMRE